MEAEERVVRKAMSRHEGLLYDGSGRTVVNGDQYEL